MLTKIKKALQECGIAEYMIKEETREGLELYFIRRTLDIRRQTRVQTWGVTVYRTFEEKETKYRGFASVVISDGMLQDEIGERIRTAYESAACVKNLWYPLPGKETSDGVEDRHPELSGKLKEQAMAAAEAVFSVDPQEDAFINSLEVFARMTQTRIVNSEGTDVSWRAYQVDGEFVAQCREPQDVETWQDFSYEQLDKAALADKAAEILRQTRDRARASAAPKAGAYRLILSDSNAEIVLRYFAERSCAEMIYPGYSSWRAGDDVQMTGSDAPVTGDRLNITLVVSEPYSSEGIRMKDRPLLENGVLKTIYGGARCCSYLSTEPTGSYTRLMVQPGTVSLEEMKQKPYLYVVSFSDFQMDSFTGSFAGEIRLGYLYDGETVTLVTGGSVNGQITEAQKQMILSKERQKTMTFDGPKAICMEDVTVAGQ